jgi:DDE superfamily endonuclease
MRGRPVVSHLLRAGRRVLGPDRAADGVRDADRGGLSRIWRHDRAHRFFSAAGWSSEQLGLALARLVVRLLAPEGEPVLVAIDDTLFTRTGPKMTTRCSRAPGQR